LLETAQIPEMSNERLTIGELSRRAGVSVKTLRFYSDEGLLPLAGRTSGRYRLYAMEVLARVGLIRALRDAGLSLDSIKKVLSREMSLADALRLQLTAVGAHIASLHRVDAALRAALRAEPGEDDLKRILATIRFSSVPENSAAVHSVSENSAPTCNLSASGLPRQPLPLGSGVVVRFLSPEEAASTLQRTQAHLGMTISPDYSLNKRAVVRRGVGPAGRGIIALVPLGMDVQVGDQVDIQGLQIDPSLPCHYIPNLIARKQ
jgi:DNA-binding transcriptional MerR regulator